MLTAIIVIVALAGGFAGGFLYRKKVSEKEISSAEEEGRRIVNEAIRNAESKKKEALLEAKEEILKSRTDYEKEEKSRRADLQRQENRLQWDSESNIQEPLSMKHNMDIIPIMKIYCRQQIISWCIRQQTDGRSTPSVCAPVVTL